MTHGFPNRSKHGGHVRSPHEMRYSKGGQLGRNRRGVLHNATFRYNASGIAISRGSLRSGLRVSSIPDFPENYGFSGFSGDIFDYDRIIGGWPDLVPGVPTYDQAVSDGWRGRIMVFLDRTSRDDGNNHSLNAVASIADSPVYMDDGTQWEDPTELSEIDPFVDWFKSPRRNWLTRHIGTQPFDETSYDGMYWQGWDLYNGDYKGYPRLEIVGGESAWDYLMFQRVPIEGNFRYERHYITGLGVDILPNGNEYYGVSGIRDPASRFTSGLPGLGPTTHPAETEFIRRFCVFPLEAEV